MSAPAPAPGSQVAARRGVFGRLHEVSLRGVALTVLLLACALSVVSFLIETATPAAEVGKFYLSEREESGEVTARAWVEPESLVPRQRLRIWIALQNGAEHPVGALRFTTVRLHQAGLAPESGDPLEETLNRALAARLQAPPGGRPARLDPENRVAFSLDLSAPAAPGLVDLALTYTWRELLPAEAGKPGAPERLGPARENRLVVGPLRVVGALQGWRRLGAALYGVIKDLALPVMLAFLTFFFKRWEDARQAQRQTEEENRQRQAHAVQERLEERRKELERHTQQARETWGRMLLISHRDTKRHYLPLQRTLRDLADRLEFRSPDDWRVQTFYHLLVLLRLMTRLREENGGFYLKSRGGEDVLADLWYVLRRAVELELGLDLYEAAVREMTEVRDFDTFKSRVAARREETNPSPTGPPSALVRCRGRFLGEGEGTTLQAGWLDRPNGGFGEFLPLLRLFYGILRFEVNRAYIYWYGSPEEPPGERVKPWVAKLKGECWQDLLRQARLEPDQIPDLAQEISDYLKEVEEDYQRLRASFLSPAPDGQQPGVP